ncbi:unnamed protein product [Cyprideis torosa]|uniref:Uncharacterized protein n=1 Tax=Cyprideis torosa TaxID=163714 RepID=A0A7R8W457_9CRUS|nr:unnamed protein product [Cyprideis torosa]CAG0881565.1 unnamed protein product [Cyprideis torosa]
MMGITIPHGIQQKYISTFNNICHCNESKRRHRIQQKTLTLKQETIDWADDFRQTYSSPDTFHDRCVEALQEFSLLTQAEIDARPPRAADGYWFYSRVIFLVLNHGGYRDRLQKLMDSSFKTSDPTAFADLLVHANFVVSPLLGRSFDLMKHAASALLSKMTKDQGPHGVRPVVAPPVASAAGSDLEFRLTYFLTSQSELKNVEQLITGVISESGFCESTDQTAKLLHRVLTLMAMNWDLKLTQTQKERAREVQEKYMPRFDELATIATGEAIFGRGTKEFQELEDFIHQPSGQGKTVTGVVKRVVVPRLDYKNMFSRIRDFIIQLDKLKIVPFALPGLPRPAIQDIIKSLDGDEGTDVTTPTAFRDLISSGALLLRETSLNSLVASLTTHMTLIYETTSFDASFLVAARKIYAEMTSVTAR